MTAYIYTFSPVRSGAKDGRHVILTLDMEALGLYEPLSARIGRATPESIANELARSFGYTIAYRPAVGGQWLTSKEPHQPKQQPVSCDPPPCNLFTLKLALNEETSFQELPLIGTINTAAYRALTGTTNTDDDRTARAISLTLAELFDRSVAFRPKSAQGDWHIVGNPNFFIPFDSETCDSLEPVAGESELYRLRELERSIR